MAGITLAQAEEKLTYWMEIDAQMGANSSVTINGKSITKHSPEHVQRQIEIWNRWVLRLSRTGGLRVAEVIPR